MNKIKYILKRNQTMYSIIRKINKRKDSKKIELFHNIGYRLNEEVFEALKNTDIQYFISFGGLLGIVRDQKFVEYDDDLDYVVLIKDDNDLIKLFMALNNAGFNLISFFAHDNKITELGFEKETIQVDFFVASEDTECLRVEAYYRAPEIMYNNNEVSTQYLVLPKFNKIDTIYLKGSHFLVPDTKEILLEYVYGDDWRVPIRDIKTGSKVGRRVKNNDDIAFKYIVSKSI